MNYVGKRMNWLRNLNHIWNPVFLLTGLLRPWSRFNVSSHPIPCLPSEDRNASLTGMLGRVYELWAQQGGCWAIIAVRGLRETLETSHGCSVHQWVCRPAPGTLACLCSEMPTMSWGQEHSLLAGSNRIALPCLQHLPAEWLPLLPLPKQRTRTSAIS